MQRLWPIPSGPGAAGPLTDDDLVELYDYPRELSRPWVQVNFVSSADGAAAVADHSAGLSHAADKRVFLLGRDLADAVLVGAGTARAERYRGIKPKPARVERRRALGLSDVPPLAMVTGSCSIRPQDPCVADTTVPPIVLTTRGAPARRKADLTAAGAEVVSVGEDTVDPAMALDALAERGLLRIDCEGGPRLFADLVAADRVDQLCLTVAPLLAGAGAPRIVAGASSPVPRTLGLASALHEDGFTMLRYRRSEPGQGTE